MVPSRPRATAFSYPTPHTLLFNCICISIFICVCICISIYNCIWICNYMCITSKMKMTTGSLEPASPPIQHHIQFFSISICIFIFRHASVSSTYPCITTRPENIVWRYIVMLISCDFQNIVEISLSHFFWPYHTIFNHEILVYFSLSWTCESLMNI